MFIYKYIYMMFFILSKRIYLKITILLSKNTNDSIYNSKGNL
ncbi:MAG: hypothetical protein Q8874_02565 [Sweet potato little leaf phytoplasma]|nr:hypothetical protein [Sweet potato little leaf phytoplasma]